MNIIRTTLIAAMSTVAIGAGGIPATANAATASVDKASKKCHVHSRAQRQTCRTKFVLPKPGQNNGTRDLHPYIKG